MSNGSRKSNQAKLYEKSNKLIKIIYLFFYIFTY